METDVLGALARVQRVLAISLAMAPVLVLVLVLVLTAVGTEVVHAASPAPSDAAASAKPSAEGATQPVSMRDALLAGGVRLLVETTVEHVDFDALKANGIEKIKAREEEDYRRQFEGVFNDLESVGITEVLGVTRKSSRADVIAALARTDKTALLAEMNRVPDASIVKLVDRKLREKGASTLAEAHEVIQGELTEFVAGLSG